MLYYGDLKNVEDDWVVYNFTSSNERYEKINLIPPNNLGSTSEYDFDVRYMNWIMSDDYRFSEMFKIIYQLAIGKDVYIIVSDDNWSENLIESLLKLIQQRYGYNSTRLNCFDDLVNVRLSTFDTNYGLFNLDMDEYRYSKYMEWLEERSMVK